MALNEEVNSDELKEVSLEELDELIAYLERLANLPPTQKKLLNLIGRLQHWLKQGVDTLEEIIKVLNEFRELLEGGGLTK